MKNKRKQYPRKRTKNEKLYSAIFFLLISLGGFGWYAIELKTFILIASILVLLCSGVWFWRLYKGI